MGTLQKVSYVEYKVSQNQWPEWQCSTYDIYTLGEVITGISCSLLTSMVTAVPIAAVAASSFGGVILLFFTFQKFQALTEDHQARAKRVPENAQPLCHDSTSTYSKLRLTAAKVHYYSVAVQEVAFSLMLYSSLAASATPAFPCPPFMVIAWSVLLLSGLIYLGAKLAHYATQQQFWPKIDKAATEKTESASSLLNGTSKTLNESLHLEATAAAMVNKT